MADLGKCIQIKQWDPLCNSGMGKAIISNFLCRLIMASATKRMINYHQMGRGQDHVTVIYILGPAP